MKGNLKDRFSAKTAAVALVFGSILIVSPPLPAAGQETPRYGGELVFAVHSDPPSYDGHREESSAVMHNLAPFYSLLLRVDPDDPNKIVPEIAESWTASQDGLTYTFKIRQGVKFHDGSPLTAKDVKATYDKIIFPPAGVVSRYKSVYSVVKMIESSDPYVVVFHLNRPSASFITTLASPWNFIYKADILATNPKWHETKEPLQNVAD